MDFICKVEWGYTVANTVASYSRYFKADQMNDATQLFAQKVTSLEQERDLTSAFAKLQTLPVKRVSLHGHLDLVWNKVSNERRVFHGYNHEGEARA